MNSKIIYRHLQQKKQRFFFLGHLFFKKFLLVFIPLFSAFFLNYLFNQEEEKKILQTPVKDLLYLPHKEIFIHQIPRLRITSQQYPTYLTYQIDGGEITSHFLLPYSFFELEGQLILIVIGDSRDIQVTYKDEPYVLNERKTQSLVFPPERQKEFKLPLFFYSTEKELDYEEN